MCQCIVVGCDHSISVLACRDGDKCRNLDCVLPEWFEGDEIICFAVVLATEDPRLIFYGEESRAVENAHADVDSILVCNRVA